MYCQGLSGCVICCFKNPEILDFTGKIYDNAFIFAHYVTSRVSGVKSVLWGINWGKMWGIKLSTQCRGGYWVLFISYEIKDIFLVSGIMFLNYHVETHNLQTSQVK